MLESPPISPKTVRHGKRSRQSSKGEVSLGELSQEDAGYDGDIEVIRPDEVEEPDSECEDDDSELGLKRLLWQADRDRSVRTGRRISQGSLSKTPERVEIQHGKENYQGEA